MNRIVGLYSSRIGGSGSYTSQTWYWISGIRAGGSPFRHIIHTGVLECQRLQHVLWTVTRQSQFLSGIHGPRVGVRQIIHVGAGIPLTLLVRFGVFRLSTFFFLVLVLVLVSGLLGRDRVIW